MYTCEVKEFATNVRVKVADGGVLLFHDRHHLYDGHLAPVVDLEANDSDVECLPGVWVNFKEGGQERSRHVSTKSWTVTATRRHGYFRGTAKIGEVVYVAEDHDDDELIVAYDKDSVLLHQVVVKKLYSVLLAHRGHLYACSRDGAAYCFDAQLNEKWRVEKNKATHSHNSSLRDPIAFGDLVIFNTGEDKGQARGNYEINAYHADTGDPAWQQVVPTSPESSHLVGSSLYVCDGGRFLKIAADTGATEMAVEFDYASHSGDKGSVSVVYPVAQGLLCFTAHNSFLELRSPDGLAVLQTIVLPQTYGYHLTPKPPVLEHGGKLYFDLGHLAMGLNPMKSAVAVLALDAAAIAHDQAWLEQRPPHQVERIQDAAGKNAYRVRMAGDNPAHAIRYATVLLKELAFQSGVTPLLELETRDRKNAGTLRLEIDVRALGSSPAGTTWTDVFSVIQRRVESDLEGNGILAGDGKSLFKVQLSVV